MSQSGGSDVPHVPVMLADVLAVLTPRDGGIYVDGTFGAGGYTRAILGSADCAVLAIDRDPGAIVRGRELELEFAGRLTLIEGCFGDMEKLVRALGHDSVDGVVLDVGVSSMQIDQAERGFSFQHDGPLDMRMSASGPSAADVVNHFDESDLARIIAVYGEEKRARAVARAIVAARQNAELHREISHKARKASDAEVEANVRARSAKLRAAERTAAPVLPFDADALGLRAVPSFLEGGA